MSQPSGSNPAGPSTPQPPTAGHARRTSTHTVPASYAYGAPSLSPPTSRKDTTTAASQRVRPSPSVSGSAAGSRSGRAARLSGGAGDPITISDDESNMHSDEEREPTAAELGRAPEPAQVRYARLAERRKSTGYSNPNASYSASAAADTSLSFRSTERSFSTNTPRAASSHNGQNTTVNIATAFAQATRVPLKPAVGASAPRPISSGGQAKRQPSPFLTEALRGQAQERTLSSILRDQAEAEAEADAMEADEGESEGSGKETHTAGPAADEGGVKKRKRTADPTFKHRTGEPKTDDSIESEAGARARSKPKNSEQQLEPNQKTNSPDSTRKASASTTRRKSGDGTYKPAAVSTASSEEDSDQTVHKRRRSKGKGRVSNGSTAGPIPIGVRDSQVWMGKKRKGRKGRRSVGLEGGQDVQDGEDDENDDDDGTPQPEESGAYDPPSQIVAPEDDEPATTYFMRQKSPPNSVRHHFPGHAFGSSTFGSSPGGHSSFQPRIGNFGNHAGADPALAALGDQSFASSFGNSLLDEGVRGNSYSFSEEERMVQEIERDRHLPPPSPSAGSASGLRKRAGPGLNRAAGLDEIEEEPRVPKQQVNGEGTLGQRLGKIVQPLWHKLQDPLIDWSKILTALGVTFLAAFVLWQLSRAGPVTSTSPAEPAFSAPDLPAGSLDELVSRLSALENATGELASASAAERARAIEVRKTAAAAYSQVKDLASDVAMARATAAAARDAATEKDEKAARQLEGALKAVRADVEGLVSRVRDLHSAQADEGKARRKLEGSIDGAAKELKGLSEQVAKVAKEVEEGRKRDEEVRKALGAFEQRLPEKFAVEMDAKGKVKLDPAFWKALKEAFPHRNELDKTVSTKVAAELARRPQGLPAKGKAGESVATPAPASTVYAQPKWDEFIETNEAALRSWLEGDLEHQSKSGAVISRRAVLEIVRKETAGLKDSFGAKLNENMEAVGQEILRKVGQQEELRREAEAKVKAAEPTKESLVDKLNPFHRNSAGGAGNGTEAAVESLIHAVVDSALLRWSKDVLGRPDYAAYPGGARVIEALTSPTYEAAPAALYQQALGWFTGSSSSGAHGRPPVMALHPDLTVGACWPFAGQQGTLGVALSRTIVPTDVTIENAALDVALDGMAKSAPREFEVWGVVEDPADRRRLAAHRLAKAKARLQAKAEGAEVADEQPVSLPDSPSHILLAQAAYDPGRANHVQTFPVTAQARELSVPVRVVVLKVLSNHGNDDYTCLYRLRVGGRTVGMIEAGEEERA